MEATVFTTLELVLGTMPGLAFSREVDSQTGYRELVIRNESTVTSSKAPPQGESTSEEEKEEDTKPPAVEEGAADTKSSSEEDNEDENGVGFLGQRVVFHF
jgi:hypothetical protein